MYKRQAVPAYCRLNKDNTVSILLPKGDRVSFPDLPGGLHSMLGFEFGAGERTLWVSTNSKYPVDVMRDYSTLWVYSDIIEHQLVGDSSVPLLRTVPTTRDVSDEYVSWHYNHPDYVRVSKKHINTITIDIRSNAGEKVVFRSGKVLCKLHFRRRSALPLY